MQKLSVIVPVHNGGDGFRRCLASLTEFAPPGTEIIVVADGESDSSWKLADEFGTRLIRLPESRGPAVARNSGAAVAEGDILFFVDADVVVHPDTMSKVLQAFEHNASLSALIGSYDDSPGASNFLSQYKNLFHHYNHQLGNEEASTFWGACGAIRRPIFEKVGGFDEKYRRPCIEDIELGYRLKRAGYQIGLEKDIQVKHLKCWKPFSLLRAEVFYRALPWTALLLEIKQESPQDYAKFTSDLNLRTSSQVSVVLVFAFLASIVIALFWPIIWLLTAALLCLVIGINIPVYHFFQKERGILFALQVIPWHIFYYFYSGLSFAIGNLRFIFKETTFAP
ncbi:Putative mycofactocin biosynthesis glycosyltransferase MftF [Acaryochloris thomasi RCC1774]|uniref:Mycofactocin biosynthesis glycosyltransferase MftF n=1 Tax=Acaryochloris thomasi RCC1774 TaxID=1764569 RepID=A0A2W1K0V2_9CYAN|nr:glycosyltransferase [Acaryochloris thomasi]PZD74211.1 Putative mycofactocin biosynthesis glycosyltransferase MftF [Acaryochloris thomasi RCC1774]